MTEQLAAADALRESEARFRALAESLRESEARYRLLADMIPQHIWTTDADGYHGYFSRRWYEYGSCAVSATT